MELEGWQDGVILHFGVTGSLCCPQIETIGTTMGQEEMRRAGNSELGHRFQAEFVVKHPEDEISIEIETIWTGHKDHQELRRAGIPSLSIMYSIRLCCDHSEDEIIV